MELAKLFEAHGANLSYTDENGYNAILDAAGSDASLPLVRYFIGLNLNVNCKSSYGERLLIGSLGYPEDRKPGFTPVLRLSIQDFHIEPVETSGDQPSWIYEHRATLIDNETIRIEGGKMVTKRFFKESHDDNKGVFQLHLSTGRWARMV